MERTSRKRLVLLGILAVLFGFSFLWFGFTKPIRLSVKVLSESIYAGDTLTTDDFQVKTKTLFGISHKLYDYTILSTDGNLNVLISAEGLQKELYPDVIRATNLSATYEGSLYVGQAPNADAISMTAEYEDGTTGDVSKVWVSHVAVPNVKDTYDLQVFCDLGDTHVTVPVITPDSMSASYLGTAIVGQRFRWNKVSVMLHYPDDTEFRTSEFVVNNSKTDGGGNTVVYEDVKKDYSTLSYPTYLISDVELFAITPYGTTAFTVNPKSMDYLSGVYEDAVYVGDMLDSSKVSVKMSLDGKEQVVNEYKFTNPGYITMKTEVRISTRYGIAFLTIDPVKVSSVQADIGDNVVEGVSSTVKSLTFVYEDDTKKTLDVDEVTFLNLPDVWAQEQTVWFTYRDAEYSFDVTAIPSDVVALRNGIATQMQTYQVSDDVIQTLTLICQRMGNKSLTINANEIALMANRYELYGSGAAGDGDALLSYVENSGYWGSKSTIEAAISDSSVNKDVEYVVRDALLNGYRSLPQYVDERILQSDVTESTSGSYAQHKTVLTLSDGTALRFYVSESDDTSVLYGYTESAYVSITGSQPASVGTENDQSGGIVIENE